MENQWQSMVDRRTKELASTIEQSREDGDKLPLVCCLADEEVCFVEGQRQFTRILSPVPHAA